MTLDQVARPLVEDIKEDLLPLLMEKREGAVRALLVNLHPADIAHVLVVLRDDELQSYLFSLLHTKETAADVLSELPTVVREHILEAMTSPVLADLVQQMSSDDAADVVQELPQERIAAVLKDLDQPEREAVQPLLAFDEESAGGIMATEVLSVSQDATILDAREVVRHRGEALEPYFFVYVTGNTGRLLGTLSMRDMVLHGSATPVVQVMDREPVTVPPTMDQEMVADLFRRYDLLAVPVVTDDSRFLGRITIDDIVDVMREEAEEDIARMAGTEVEEFDETSAKRIAFYRLPWILVSLAGGFLAGVVLDRFAGRISIGLSLVAFVPVIMAMGGNAGSQAAITMVRLLSLREVSKREILSIVWREARVGMLMGLITGAVIGAVAAFWRGAMFYGWVVGLSMAMAILVAVAMGTLTPVLFKRLKVDPAIATGPFVTVSNDATGLLIYFGLASLFLRVFGV